MNKPSEPRWKVGEFARSWEFYSCSLTSSLPGESTRWPRRVPIMCSEINPHPAQGVVSIHVAAMQYPQRQIYSITVIIPCFLLTAKWPSREIAAVTTVAKKLLCDSSVTTHRWLFPPWIPYSNFCFSLTKILLASTSANSEVSVHIM